MILNLTLLPRGVITSTVSPFLRPMIALPTGDSFVDVQRANGVRSHAVWRNHGNPNLVVVLHVFDSNEAAQAFFAMPELREAMGSAGVDESTLRIDFFDETTSGTL